MDTLDFINLPDEPDTKNTPDDNENEIENIVNQDMNNIHIDRYTEIIKLMGLNENINYPANVILTGIIELFMCKNNENNNKFSRNLTFRTDLASKKISRHLYGEYVTSTGLSEINLSRTIRRLYRHHKYNSNIIIPDSNKIIPKNTSSLGFSYTDLRWSPLVSYDI
jgi:poly-beta-hydroxyalkanoate depolymerase